MTPNWVIALFYRRRLKNGVSKTIQERMTMYQIDAVSEEEAIGKAIVWGKTKFDGFSLEYFLAQEIIKEETPCPTTSSTQPPRPKR